MRPLLLVLLLLVAAVARCEFTLDGGKPTGGTSAVGSGGPPPTYYMASDGSGWYGGTSNGVQADSCSDPVTWAWTWQGSDPPPECVVLKIEARAQWSGPPGACDDGLGQQDAPTQSYAGPYLIGESQSGVKYVVASVSGGHVTYQIEPSASATWGTCSVGTRVTLTPVTIGMTGIIIDPSTENTDALVGKGVTAALNGLPDSSCSFGNYSWSANGDTFESWSVSQSQATATVDPVPSLEWSKETPNWYWRTDQNARTVTASATLYVNGVSKGTVTAARTVDVLGPDLDCSTSSAGSSSLFGGYFGLHYVRAGNFSGSTPVPGQSFAGNVGTPILFASPGYGQWQFVQTVESTYRRKYYNGGYSDDYPPYSSGLDNFWPYAGPYSARIDPTDPTLTFGFTNDSPEITLGGNDLSYTITDSFEMSVMYQPPGNDCQWVRVWKFDWIWYGTDTRANTSASWTNPPPCPTETSASQKDTLHPTWYKKLSNDGSVSQD